VFFILGAIINFVNAKSTACARWDPMDLTPGTFVSVTDPLGT
jgi:hypothetical protein